MHHTALPHRRTAPSTELCCAVASLGFARAARGTAVPAPYTATLSRCFTLPSRWSASPWPRKSTLHPSHRSASPSPCYVPLCKTSAVRGFAAARLCYAMPLRRTHCIARLCQYAALLCSADAMPRCALAMACFAAAWLGDAMPELRPAKLSLGLASVAAPMRCRAARYYACTVLSLRYAVPNHAEQCQRRSELSRACAVPSYAAQCQHIATTRGALRREADANQRNASAKHGQHRRSGAVRRIARASHRRGRPWLCFALPRQCQAEQRQRPAGLRFATAKQHVANAWQIRAVAYLPDICAMMSSASASTSRAELSPSTSPVSMSTAR